MVRDYRKRFKVDQTCALSDLNTIGALSPEKLAMLKAQEEIRLRQKREERARKQAEAFFERWPNSDDRFFYIAGYTSGGAPYGVTWEEMDMLPYDGAMPLEMDGGLENDE